MQIAAPSNENTPGRLFVRGEAAQKALAGASACQRTAKDDESPFRLSTRRPKHLTPPDAIVTECTSSCRRLGCLPAEPHSLSCWPFLLRRCYSPRRLTITRTSRRSCTRSAPSATAPGSRAVFPVDVSGRVEACRADRNRHQEP